MVEHNELRPFACARQDLEQRPLRGILTVRDRTHAVP